jgi:hypothetical protein
MLAGGAALIWYMSQNPPPASGLSISTTATPLSIYPEYGYLQQATSMAATPAQKASTVVQPTGYFAAMQQQNVWAMQTQCAGSYPGCTPVLGDTQLGF